MAIRRGKSGSSDRFYFLGAPKSLRMMITAKKLKDACCLKGKLWQKSRDTTLLIKVHIVKSMIFPVVMRGCEIWTMQKAECQRIDIFEMGCWRRLLRVPWTARRLNQWCYLSISSFAAPIFFCLQSFPASGSFPVSQFFPWGGQSIGASASVLPMNIQVWFPLGLTSWISLESMGLSRVFSSTTVHKHWFFVTQAAFVVQLSRPYITTGETIALTRRSFVDKVMSITGSSLACWVDRTAFTACPFS